MSLIVENMNLIIMVHITYELHTVLFITSTYEKNTNFSIKNKPGVRRTSFGLEQ